MYCSFAAMGGGLLWLLIGGTSGGNAELHTGVPINAILSELVAGNPLALLSLGVLLLLATPGLTLLVEIATFAADRNWRYVGIASIVGVILLISIAVSMKWIQLF
jgi:uncharacterized membrane protein